MRTLTSDDPTRRLEELSRSRHYVHLALAKATMPLGADPVDAFARRVGANDPYLALVRKGEVEAMTSVTAGPLAALRAFSDGFMARQRLRTIAGRTREFLRLVPMNTAVAVTTAGSSADWIGIANPIRVSSMAFDLKTLPSTAIAAIVVVSRELAQSSVPGAVGVVEDDLLEATARAEDSKLLSQEDAIEGLRPAGFLAGLSPVGAGSPESLEDDVAVLIESVRDGEPEAPYFVLSKYTARYLVRQRTAEGVRIFPDVRLTDGGDIWGIPVLISAAAESRLVLFNARTIAFADEGVILGSSGTVSLQLSDSPTSGAASQVSLFQSNSIGLKAERWVHWIKGYDDSVAFADLPIGSPA